MEVGLGDSAASNLIVLAINHVLRSLFAKYITWITMLSCPIYYVK